MKSTIFTPAVLLALGLVAGASVVRIDVSDEGNVEVDVNTNSKAHSPPPLPAGQRGRVGSIISEEPVETHAGDPEPIKVDLGYEKHIGNLYGKDNKYIVFKNIPYAAPPVGELRFVRPQQPDWNESYVNPGDGNPRCPQMHAGWFGRAKEFSLNYLNAFKVLDPKYKDHYGPDQYPEQPELDFETSEDCLYLDVHVPVEVWNNRNKPAIFKPAVLVFIHGGGFIYGWKDQYGSPEGLFEAAESDKEPFIYITLNYRLGAFGFLGGDTYLDETWEGNVGLLDQYEALKWVQYNIHSFGGDSRRITVLGQSAGASSILHHITAAGGRKHGWPSFPPAFQSAILQSPGFFPEGNPKETDDTYKEFLKLTNSTDFYDLQNKSTEALKAANAKMTYLSQYGLFRFGPSVDQRFVADLPGKELAAGNHHKGISLMIGHTQRDGLVFTPPWLRTNGELRNYTQYLFPNMSSDNLDKLSTVGMYRIPEWIKDPKEQIRRVFDMLDDVAISCNNYFLTKAFLKVEGLDARPLYRFVFNKFPAIHGSDVNYTYWPKDDPLVSEGLAKYMQGAFVNFTRFRDPNDEGEDKVVWAPYKNETGKKRVMNLGDLSGLLGTHLMGDDLLDADRCEFWQPAPYRAPSKYPRVSTENEHRPVKQAQHPLELK